MREAQRTLRYTLLLLRVSNGSKMVISVGIRRIVVLADYPEDGTQLLNEAKITLIKLNLDFFETLDISYQGRET